MRRSFSEFFRAHGLTALGLMLVLACNLAIRWHLRQLPLERDEGEYAYAGQLILQGIPPYQLVYNMKFPGVYFAYAVLMSVFGQTPEGIHSGIILVSSASAILVFLIGCELLGAFGGQMSAAIFVGLSATPMAFGLAGHATHFMTLFVCAGAFVLLKAEKSSSLLWPAASGMAFGFAVLMKQHAAVFALLAAGCLVWQSSWKQRIPCAQFIPRMGAFFAGFAMPLLLTAAALAQAGVWNRFCFWTIQYARQYVSIFPLQSVPQQFIEGFGPVFGSGVWAWTLGVAGLGMMLVRTGRRRAAWFGAGLFLAGLAAACPGFYFRGHYFLTAMPGLALLNAALILAVADELKKFRSIRALQWLPAFLFCGVAGDLVVRNFETWFRLTPHEISRNLYDASPFPESTEIAGYLAAHTSPRETIAVLGSEPQIYFLARRHSASGFIYMYPLTEPQPLAPPMRNEFINEIETARPAYIMCVNLASSWLSVIYPGAPPSHSILDWWHGYSKNYELVGAVDVFEDKPSDFLWDGRLANRTNSSPPEILIYRRQSQR